MRPQRDDRMRAFRERVDPRSAGHEAADANEMQRALRRHLEAHERALRPAAAPIRLRVD